MIRIGLVIKIETSSSYCIAGKNQTKTMNNKEQQQTKICTCKYDNDKTVIKKYY